MDNPHGLINDEGEVVIRLADGCTIRSGAEDLISGEYVRVCDPDGSEVAYWHFNEWVEDPILVMGAFLNTAAGLRLETRGANPSADPRAAAALDGACLRPERESDEDRPLGQAGDVHMRCVCCYADVAVPKAGGLPPTLHHKTGCLRSEWPLIDACTDEEGEADWRYWIATTGAAALEEKGAVLVLLRDGVRVASRVYKLSEYADSHQLLDVACTRQTRVQNETEGNVYVVQRHDAGVTVYTGRHTILVDLDNERLRATGLTEPRPGAAEGDKR